MRVFVLVFHLMLTISMVVVILIQRSEGGGLGLGGGKNAGGLMMARGASNFLTRVTAVLATFFIGTNLWLAILARQEVDKKIVPAGSPAAAEGTAQNPPVSKGGEAALDKSGSPGGKAPNSSK